MCGHSAGQEAKAEPSIPEPQMTERYSAVAYCSLIWQDAVDVYPVDILNSPATQ